MRYAISDIHGTGRAFLKLLDHVDPDPEQLVICGDLGDRGLETWEVFDECSMLVDEGTVIIRGNHDYWHREHVNGRMGFIDFTHPDVGGLTTLKSIELAKEKHGQQRVAKTLEKVWNAMVPYHETDDYIFVHAGIDPMIPYMEDQRVEILMMGHDRFKNPQVNHAFEQVIVFGHTPTPAIHRDIKEDDATIWFSRKARKMCIDTGAGFGCRLTLADLWAGKAYAYDFAKRDIIEYQFKSPDPKRRKYL